MIKEKSEEYSFGFISTMKIAHLFLLAFYTNLTYTKLYNDFILYIFNDTIQKGKNESVPKIPIYFFNSSKNISFNIFGFAFPLVCFMACPTKNPNALSFPPL